MGPLGPFIRRAITPCVLPCSRRSIVWSMDARASSAPPAGSSAVGGLPGASAPAGRLELEGAASAATRNDPSLAGPRRASRSCLANPWLLAFRLVDRAFASLAWVPVCDPPSPPEMCDGEAMPPPRRHLIREKAMLAAHGSRGGDASARLMRRESSSVERSAVYRVGFEYEYERKAGMFETSRWKEFE